MEVCAYELVSIPIQNKTQEFPLAVRMTRSLFCCRVSSKWSRGQGKLGRKEKVSCSTQQLLHAIPSTGTWAAVQRGLKGCDVWCSCGMMGFQQCKCIRTGAWTSSCLK